MGAVYVVFNDHNTRENLGGIFHAEFSGILFRNHPERFNREPREAIPPPGFASRLPTGDAALWASIGKFSRIRAKANEVVAFHGRFDAIFTPAFFQSLLPNAFPDPNS